MAQWVLVENNQVKEYHDLLPKNWGNYSGLNLSADDLPFLKSLGWYKVRKNPENYNPYTQRLTGYNYVIHENDVEEIPIIENMSEEEVTANRQSRYNSHLWQIRQHRNRLLQSTDYTQVLDMQDKYTEQQKQNILAYRQALRDITANITEFNFESATIIWPVDTENLVDPNNIY